VLVAAGTMARTALRVVEDRRARGERVGLVRAKLFRPFVREELVRALGPASRVAVLDRDHSPGSGRHLLERGGHESRRPRDVLVQDYIVGLGGTDVPFAVVGAIVDDLAARDRPAAPVFFEDVA